MFNTVPELIQSDDFRKLDLEKRDLVLRNFVSQRGGDKDTADRVSQDYNNQFLAANGNSIDQEVYTLANNSESQYRKGEIDLSTHKANLQKAAEIKVEGYRKREEDSELFQRAALRAEQFGVGDGDTFGEEVAGFLKNSKEYVFGKSEGDQKNQDALESFRRKRESERPEGQSLEEQQRLLKEDLEQGKLAIRQDFDGAAMQAPDGRIILKDEFFLKDKEEVRVELAKTDIPKGQQLLFLKNQFGGLQSQKADQYKEALQSYFDQTGDFERLPLKDEGSLDYVRRIFGSEKSENPLAGIAKNSGAKLANSAEGMVSGVTSAVTSLFDEEEGREVAKKSASSQFARSILAGQAVEPSVKTELFGDLKVSDAVGQLVNIVPAAKGAQVGGKIAQGLNLTGKAATGVQMAGLAAGSFASSASSQFNQSAADDNLTLKEAFTDAAVIGTIEAGMSVIGGGGGVEKALMGGTKEALKGRLRISALKLGYNIGEEALEEAATGALQFMAVEMKRNPNATAKDLADSMGQSAFIGGVLGPGFSIGSKIKNKVTNQTPLEAISSPPAPQKPVREQIEATKEQLKEGSAEAPTSQPDATGITAEFEQELRERSRGEEIREQVGTLEQDAGNSVVIDSDVVAREEAAQNAENLENEDTTRESTGETADNTQPDARTSEDNSEVSREASGETEEQGLRTYPEGADGEPLGETRSRVNEPDQREEATGDGGQEEAAQASPEVAEEGDTEPQPQEEADDSATPSKTRLDLTLDKFEREGLQELDIVVEGITREQADRAIEIANSRGIEGFFNGRGILIRRPIEGATNNQTNEQTKSDNDSPTSSPDTEGTSNGRSPVAREGKGSSSQETLRDSNGPSSQGQREGSSDNLGQEGESSLRNAGDVEAQPEQQTPEGETPAQASPEEEALSERSSPSRVREVFSNLPLPDVADKGRYQGKPSEEAWLREQIESASLEFNGRKPVSSEAVDEYGILLPEGYEKQGRLYVYQQQSQPPAPLENNTKPSQPEGETPAQAREVPPESELKTFLGEQVQLPDGRTGEVTQYNIGDGRLAVSIKREDGINQDFEYPRSSEVSKVTDIGNKQNQDSAKKTDSVTDTPTVPDSFTNSEKTQLEKSLPKPLPKRTGMEGTRGQLIQRAANGELKSVKGTHNGGGFMVRKVTTPKNGEVVVLSKAETRLFNSLQNANKSKSKFPNEGQKSVRTVRSKLKDYFGGEIPSNIEVIYDPDGYFDGKAEGGKVTINSSLSEGIDLVELLEEEITHAVEKDAEVKALLDKLERELDEDTLQEIDDDMGGLYSDDEISAEVRARGVAKALKKARETTAFQKLVARIKELLGMKSDAKLIRLAEQVIARARAKITGSPQAENNGPIRFAKKKKKARTQAAGKKTGIIHEVQDEAQIQAWLEQNAGLQAMTVEESIEALTNPEFVGDLQARAKNALGLEGNATFVTSAAQMMALDLTAQQFTRDGDVSKVIAFHNAMTRMGSVNIEELMTLSDAARAMRGRRGHSDAIVLAFNAIKAEQERAAQQALDNMGVEGDARELGAALDKARHEAQIDPDESLADDVADEVEKTPAERKQEEQSKKQILKALLSYKTLFEKAKAIQERLKKFSKTKQDPLDQGLDLMQDLEGKSLEELSALLDQVSDIADKVEFNESGLKEAEKVKAKADKAKGSKPKGKKRNKAERQLAGIHMAAKGRINREGDLKKGRSRVSKLWSQYVNGDLTAAEYATKLKSEGVGDKMVSDSVELGNKYQGLLKREKKAKEDLKEAQSFADIKKKIDDLDIKPAVSKARLKKLGTAENRKKTMDRLIQDQFSQDLNARRGKEEWVQEAVDLGFSQTDAEVMFDKVNEAAVKADALAEASKADNADLATEKEIASLEKELDTASKEKDFAEPEAFVRERKKAIARLKKKQLSENPFTRDQFMAAAKENGLTDSQAGRIYELLDRIGTKKNFSKNAKAEDRFMNAILKYLNPNGDRKTLASRSGRNGEIAKLIKDWVKPDNASPTLAEVNQAFTDAGFSKDDAGVVYNQIQLRRSIDEANQAFARGARAINNLTAASIRAFIYNNDVKNMSREQREKELADFLEQAANLEPARARQAAKEFSSQFEKKMKAAIIEEIRKLQGDFEKFANRYLFDDDGNFIKEVKPNSVQSQELVDLIDKAMSLNVASPEFGLAESFAALNGWDGFKTSDLQRLVEITQELKNPNLVELEKQQLFSDLDDITQQFISDATWGERIIEYNRANILSGFSSIGVNLAALFDRTTNAFGQVFEEMAAAKGLSDIAAAPFTVLKTYFNTTVDGAFELGHAWKTNSSYTQIADHFVVRKQASLADWRKARKMRWNTPVEKGKYLFLGFPSQVMRMLLALDSSTNFAEKRAAEQLMTNRLMRESGLTRKQMRDIATDISNVASQAYDLARADGMTGLQAKRYAMDVGQSYLISQGQKNGVTAEQAAEIHEASLEAAKALTGTQTREGFVAEGTKGGTVFDMLSTLGRDLASSESKADQAKGVALSMMLPIFSIPANIAHRSLDHALFGGVGMLRLAQAKKGNPNFALLANNQQLYNNRKGQILAGTIVQSLATLLWGMNFLKDDDDEDKWLRINASAPKDFETRELWKAAGRKALTVQVRTGKGWTNLEYTRGILQPLTPLFYMMGNAENYKLMQQKITQKEKDGEVDPEFKVNADFFSKVAARSMADYALQGFSVFQAIERNGYLTDKLIAESGDQSGNGTGKAVAVFASYKAGGLIPMSGMLRTYNKLAEPRDSTTAIEAFWKPLPIVGATDLAGKKHVDFMGNDSTMDGKYWSNLSNRITRLNMPISWSAPQDQELYEPYMRQNNIPSPYRPEKFNSEVLKEKKRDATKKEWQDYIQGFTSTVKSETKKNLETLNETSKKKDDSFGKEVTKITKAANKAGLLKSIGKK